MFDNMLRVHNSVACRFLDVQYRVGQFLDVQVFIYSPGRNLGEL